MNAARDPKSSGERDLRAAGKSEDTPEAPGPTSASQPPSNPGSRNVQGGPPTSPGAEPATTVTNGTATTSGHSTTPPEEHDTAATRGQPAGLTVRRQDVDPPARPGSREHPAVATTGSHCLADAETVHRAYDRCRRTAAVHGRTYYLATRLLSADRRPAVYALYAFARMVDDIVDGPASHQNPAAVLDSVEVALRTSWSSPAAPLPFVPYQLSATVPAESQEPGATPPPDSPRSGTTPSPDSLRLGALPAGFDEVALALTDTVTRFTIGPRHFWTFLDSMRMDAPGSPLFRNRYPTMADLDEYMRGSAAAIGLQLLPVLGTVVPRAAAEPAAAALGRAFQLTNFLRDIDEDLDRDRIYLPADELAAFGVDEELLVYCHRTRSTDRRVRRALAHLIAVNRDLYRRAHPGIGLLNPRVRPGIRTAATVYAAILDRIEDCGYDVFARRAVVPGPRRLRLAVSAMLSR